MLLVVEGNQISHFWVASSSFFETLLFVVPPFQTTGDTVSVLRLSDADGALAGESTISTPAGKPGMIELGDLLRNCKLESGIQHGHLTVHSPAGTKHYCRVYSKDGAAVLGESISVGHDSGAFFPVNFGRDRRSFLCITNNSDKELEVKIRLFLGKRSPDRLCLVPASGSRFICIESEFEDVAAVEDESTHQGYLRLGAKPSSEYGVQLVDWVGAQGEAGLFNSVS